MSIEGSPASARRAQQRLEGLALLVFFAVLAVAVAAAFSLGVIHAKRKSFFAAADAAQKEVKIGAPMRDVFYWFGRPLQEGDFEAAQDSYKITHIYYEVGTRNDAVKWYMWSFLTNWCMVGETASGTVACVIFHST